MKKISFVLAFLMVVVVVYFLFPGNENYSQVCFGENCFKIEIAETQQEREKGLMFREKLEQDRGMLFIFENSDVHPFWMKNTLFPLDIIWLDENNLVVFIEKNCQPCLTEECQNFAPFVSSRYVLEINAGLTDKINLSLGDRMEIK